MNYRNPLSIFAGLLIFFFSFKFQAQNSNKSMKDSLQLYNKMLSKKEMHEDLKVLLEIHEKANSGLYNYHTKKQVDSIYNKAFEKTNKPMRILDFYKIMLHLADYEGSVHNYTIPDLELISFLKRQKSFFPYPLIYINGQIIFDGTSAPIPHGSRILSINGTSDLKLMKSFYKYYPADGYNITEKLSSSVERAFGINYLMEYGVCNEYTVKYRLPESNSIKKTVLPAVTLKQRDANIKNRFSAPVTELINSKTQAPYSFKMLNTTIGLLNLRWFGMVSGAEDPGFKTYVEFIESTFKQLTENNISNLIIDVRNNPGGSDPTFEQPVMYLTDKPFKENVEANIIFDPNDLPMEKYFWGVSTSQRMDSISLVNGKKYLKDQFPIFKDNLSIQDQKHNLPYNPKSPTYKGKVYLLINENVASAASHFASLVKGFVANVTIVGVETVGGYYLHNGHSPLVYELPNSKVKTQFSIVNLVQDAPKKDNQPKGHGIIPDYEVWPTLGDYFQHKDTQMEFTLKLIAK